jgi:hypothetical protein
VRLGEPSKWLTDIDLDTVEAVLAAKDLLRATDRIHGRPGKSYSHYWFYAENSVSEQFKDVDGQVLVEIRSTGGQTVLPPSTHPSGEVLAWEIDKEPAKIEFDPLRQSVALVATAALLARHWPKGSRHICARDVAGYLAAREIDGRLIETVIRVAASIAGDSEVDDRVRVAHDSVEQFKSGGKTTGLPSLQSVIGKDVADRLREWLGVSDAFPLTEAGDAEAFAASYGERVRFDHRRGRWLVTDGGLWIPDHIEHGRLPPRERAVDAVL